YQADSGEISVDGKVTRIATPTDAIKAGIGMVHQHFMLVGKFTVLENIVLGAEGGFVLNRGLGKARRELERLEKDYGLQVDPDSPSHNLPVGLQQRGEFLKALYRGGEVT